MLPYLLIVATLNLWMWGHLETEQHQSPCPQAHSWVLQLQLFPCASDYLPSWDCRILLTIQQLAAAWEFCYKTRLSTLREQRKSWLPSAKSCLVDLPTCYLPQCQRIVVKKNFDAIDIFCYPLNIFYYPFNIFYYTLYSSPLL